MGIFSEPIAIAIGWAIVHSLWQGAAIAAAAAWLLAALRRAGADVRYVIGSTSLLLMLTLPVATTVQTSRSVVEQDFNRAVSGAAVQDSRPARRDAARQDSRPARRDAARQDSSPALGSSQLERLLPIVTAVWFTGVAILFLRLLGGWLIVQRLKTRRSQPAGDRWQQIVARLARRLQLTRSVRLLESAAVDVPTVIGWLRPIVLVPASALAGLSPQQLEAILAHELAHVRRHDYLVNLLQTVVETLLFYHPAAWWLSRRVRAERENCCDDLAVSVCGDPVAYACALAELEALRGSAQALALAATGGHLLNRVRRLLGAPAPHDGRSPIWLVVIALGIAALSAVVADARRDAPSPTSASQSSRPESADSKADRARHAEIEKAIRRLRTAVRSEDEEVQRRAVTRLEELKKAQALQQEMLERPVNEVSRPFVLSTA